MTDKEEILAAIAALDKKVDTHITGQQERCKGCAKDIEDLEHTVFGNGREGLKTGLTKLGSRVNVVFGVLTVIGIAALSSLGGWISTLFAAASKVPK